MTDKTFDNQNIFSNKGGHKTNLTLQGKCPLSGEGGRPPFLLKK